MSKVRLSVNVGSRMLTDVAGHSFLVPVQGCEATDLYPHYA